MVTKKRASKLFKGEKTISINRTNKLIEMQEQKYLMGINLSTTDWTLLLEALTAYHC